ncbi:hypothetical protein [Nocardioides sp.]|uniref:hypothetical protein n=1 Tax=Nocardioides sp. TaxID=35761 RepID=UPI0037837936
MSERTLRPTAWQVALVTIALVAAGALVGGGAWAKARYDAENARRVGGLLAVKAATSAASRAGKLVATDKNGRVPDSARLGGATLAQVATMSIPPQSAGVSGTAAQTENGPTLSGTGTGEARVSFIVPPTHQASRPITLDLVVQELTNTSCSAYVSLTGLHGEVGPASAVSNGAWYFPGTTSSIGQLDFPVDDGQVHVFTFRFADAVSPGGYLGFSLLRDADSGNDTCSQLRIIGYQVHT